jgi:glycosyltransferase involved in cell wall biosynthesis
MYKGTDVLIDAIAESIKSGLDLTCVIVGDGKFRPVLMAQAEQRGMAGRIEFAGWVTAGQAVRRALDASDLFILPSRTEGLPRALVEAMARGLPCIGSAVGGIPELLDAPELVPAGDARALSLKIQEVLTNPNRMAALSRRNLTVARDYCDTVLNERRIHFYQLVRDLTHEWELRHSL